MRLEDTRVDKVPTDGLELPASHTEGIIERDVEGMSPIDAVRRYGESFYGNVLESQPGRLGAYEKLSEGGGREGFAKDYARYVLSPVEMRAEDPELYDFMRDRIFRGREYEAEEVPGASSDGPSFGSSCNKLDIVAVDEVSFTGSPESIERIDALRDKEQEWLKKRQAAADRVKDRTNYLIDCVEKNNNVENARSDLKYAQTKLSDAQRELSRIRKNLQDAIS